MHWPLANRSIPSWQIWFPRIIICSWFILRNFSTRSAPNNVMLFCLSGSLSKFGCTPKMSSFAVGSLQSSSIAACWFSLLIWPRVIFRGLYIFSMSSTFCKVAPIPACTQKTLLLAPLSLMMAARGRYSNMSLSFWKIELGSLMSSPRRRAHSYPNPK